MSNRRKFAREGCHSDTRLANAIRKLARQQHQTPPPAGREHLGDWQKFIEVEMSAFNRRLARIETVTLVLLVLTVVADVTKAAELLRSMMPLP